MLVVGMFVFNDVNCNVDEGMIMLIIGLNMVGKSMFIR